MEDTIENATKPSADPRPGEKRPKKAAKGKKTDSTAKSTKKAKPAKKSAAGPATERANKKAKVIAMMKRAKGATLAEIMAATKWRPHTVRGFVSIIGARPRRQAAGHAHFQSTGGCHVELRSRRL